MGGSAVLVAPCHMGLRVRTVQSVFLPHGAEGHNRLSVSLPHGAEGHNRSVSCHMGPRVRTASFSYATWRQDRTRTSPHSELPCRESQQPVLSCPPQSGGTVLQCCEVLLRRLCCRSSLPAAAALLQEQLCHSSPAAAASVRQKRAASSPATQALVDSADLADSVADCWRTLWRTWRTVRRTGWRTGRWIWRTLADSDGSWRTWRTRLADLADFWRTVRTCCWRFVASDSMAAAPRRPAPLRPFCSQGACSLATVTSLL